MVHSLAPFDTFSPRQYLDTYYDGFDGEDEFLLQFYHEVYQALPPVPKMLEFGCGPAIYPLISARACAEEITIAEFLPGNRDELELWRCSDKNAFSWRHLFEYVRGLEGTEQSAEDMESELRGKIKAIIPCDAFSAQPLGAFRPPEFGLVSVNFCPESITDNRRDFENSFHNIAALVPPESYFVFCCLSGSTGWTFAGQRFPSYPVKQSEVQELLTGSGFTLLELRTAPASGGNEYSELLVSLSQRLS